MRKALRATLLLLFAYLFQATALPSLKIGDVMIDIMIIAMFSVGYSLGAYGGIAGALLMAAILETTTGEMSGVTTAVCLITGGTSAFAEPKIRAYERAGKRGRERLVKWLTPIALIGLVVMVREGIHIIYFYLTGVEIVFIHFFRLFLAVFFTMAFALPLFPLFCGFLLRPPEQTFIAKRIAKLRKQTTERAERKKAREIRKRRAEPEPDYELLQTDLDFSEGRRIIGDPEDMTLKKEKAQKEKAISTDQDADNDADTREGGDEEW